MLVNRLAAIILTASLAGCAGALPGNPQGYAGINHGEFEYNPKSGKLNGHIYGGKENEDVSLSMTTPKGLKVVYDAEGSKAFDGQAVRGAVEKAVSDDVKEAAPGIVSDIVDAIQPVITGQ